VRQRLKIKFYPYFHGNPLLLNIMTPKKLLAMCVRYDMLRKPVFRARESFLYDAALSSTLYKSPVICKCFDSFSKTDEKISANSSSPWTTADQKQR